jgi:hypothetical protein
MTDQPANRIGHDDSQATNLAAVLDRIETLKRGAVEIRDALHARIAKYRDPDSFEAQSHARMLSQIAENMRDEQKRQLRSNVRAFCLALFTGIMFLANVLAVILGSVLVWNSTT